MKNLEVSYTNLQKPDLNEGKVFERLVLIRSGLTQSN